MELQDVLERAMARLIVIEAVLARLLADSEIDLGATHDFASERARKSLPTKGFPPETTQRNGDLLEAAYDALFSAAEAVRRIQRSAHPTAGGELED